MLKSYVNKTQMLTAVSYLTLLKLHIFCPTSHSREFILMHLFLGKTNFPSLLAMQCERDHGRTQICIVFQHSLSTQSWNSYLFFFTHVT